MGARFSAPVQTGPGAHPASCTMGTESFPGVKSGRGVTMTPHPLLVPWSKKGRAIPLLPTMGRTACTEPQCLYKGALYLTVELYLYSPYGPYGLYRASVPEQGCTLPFIYDCHGRNVGLMLHLRAQNIEENGVGAFSFSVSDEPYLLTYVFVLLCYPF